MNILLINGSPRAGRSNSMKLAEAFVEGFKECSKANGTTDEVYQIDVAKANIAPCKGCFACWKNTEGKCCIQDDMTTVIEKQIWADVIIWSFPLYYFNVPGILKNLIDRQLPMNLPFMIDRTDGTGSGSHPSRYDMSGKKHVLISTCGFYSAKGNYDCVRSMFDHFCGKDRYETIFCGQGELFDVKSLSSRTDQYLESVHNAGREFASGGITEKTRNALNTLLYPKEVFEQMADASWGISKDTGKKEDKSLVFTRQMAALYNRGSYDGKDRVLEIHYTDIDKCYQILLNKDGSKVFTDGSLKATTRIDTPWDVWLSISSGEIGGSAALAKKMYKVSGDFSLMINWDKFFGNISGGTQDEPKATGKQKKPTMLTMLIPWIVLWVAVPINGEVGPLITLAACGLLPLIMAQHNMTIYDKISIAAVAVLSLFSALTGNARAASNLGYLCFGLMWLLSCLTKEPLCAAYVKYNYNGDSALKNPIFMKTNYILAAAWGVLYLCTAVWTFFLSRAGLGTSLIIINNLMPVLMGIFTRWFEGWYPAWVAGGGGK